MRATTRGTSSLTNSTWAMSGGSDVALPKPAPNRTHAEEQQRTLEPPAANEDKRAGELHPVTGAGHQPPVGPRRHQPAEQRAAGDRQRGRQPHGEARLLRPERRHQQREQVRDQADLREQPERHAGRQRQEAAVAPQQRPGSGLAGRRVTEVDGVPGASPSGVSPICCGVRENTAVGQHPHRDGDDRPIAAAAAGKPKPPIATTHSGEKIDAADAAAVVGHGQRRRPRAHEPGRDDALSAAALMPPQPAPLSSVATNSCQGAVALAQPRTPSASARRRPW